MSLRPHTKRSRSMTFKGKRVAFDGDTTVVGDVVTTVAVGTVVAAVVTPVEAGTVSDGKDMAIACARTFVDVTSPKLHSLARVFRADAKSSMDYPCC